MKVRFTPRAIEDLHGIADYIAVKSPRGSLSVELALLKTIDEHADFPMLGLEEKELEVRRLLVPKYPYAISITASKAMRFGLFIFGTAGASPWRVAMFERSMEFMAETQKLIGISLEGSVG